MDYNEVTETKIRKLLDIAISGEREWQFEQKKNHIQIAIQIEMSCGKMLNTLQWTQT